MSMYMYVCMYVGITACVLSDCSNQLLCLAQKLQPLMREMEEQMSALNQEVRTCVLCFISPSGRTLRE